MPEAAMSSASSITLAACSSAFDGMQPTFKHTPPNIGQRSISVTLRPRSAALNAAVYPPTPAPSTTKSTAPGGGAPAALVGAAACDHVGEGAGVAAGAGVVAAGPGEAAGAGEAAAVVGEAAGAARGGTAVGAAAGVGAASLTCTVAISAPADTSSPFFSSTELTTPFTGDGTSIEAFSVSSVMSGSSMRIWLPFLTRTSTTLTPLASPRSGIRTSTTLTARP